MLESIVVAIITGGLSLIGRKVVVQGDDRIRGSGGNASCGQKDGRDEQYYESFH